MEVVTRLKGKVVALDSAPLIYYFENKSDYLPFLSNLFQSHANGDFLFVTSTITLLEVLVLPLREGRRDLVEKYSSALEFTTGVKLISVRADIATKAAEIRATFNLKTPDAIQAAVALQSGADIMLTNDPVFRRVAGYEVLILNEVIGRNV